MFDTPSSSAAAAVNLAEILRPGEKSDRQMGQIEAWHARCDPILQCFLVGHVLFATLRQAESMVQEVAVSLDRVSLTELREPGNHGLE